MFEAKEVKQNTVSARGQVPLSSLLQIYDVEDAKIRILFVGNSITYHAPKPEIGWFGSWGMAASCEKNDYVHRVVNMLETYYGKVGYGVAQLARWEVTFDEKSQEWKDNYCCMESFDADVAVIRMGENIPDTKLELTNVRSNIEDMITFFGKGCKQIIVTDCFWKREKLDNLLKKICEEKEYTFCQLSDLYENRKSMALEQFEHQGVALHPSDYGMELIAKRIVELINMDQKRRNYRS